MGLTIRIGQSNMVNEGTEAEPDMYMCVVPIQADGTAPAQYSTTNTWSMSYHAAHWGAQHLSWFNSLYTDTRVVHTLTPEIVESVQKSEHLDGWENFITWFKYWCQYALANCLNPIIKFS